MRKLQKPPAKQVRRKRQEPLAEGLQIIVPTDSLGRRLWRKMSDGEIVDYARKVMRINDVAGKNELGKVDCGLYQTLRKRKLLGQVGFEEKRRKQRDWKKVSDEEVVEIAKKLMEEKKISMRRELQKTDRGLYNILEKRRLLGRIDFEEKKREERPWKDMSDEEILDYAREVMEKKGITERSELDEADPGLYRILGVRRLREAIGFKDKQKKHRSWKEMSNEEVVEYAKKLMKEKKITGRKELQNTDSGLYTILRIRGLLDWIKFEEKLRSWEGISNEEILKITRKIIEENEIDTRNKLEKVDSGLYTILKKKGLLDIIFAPIDQQKTDRARDAVIHALSAFGSEEKIEVA